jgi:hypothetical protein
MYEMISGDDQKLFYVKRKPSSKYHNQCDIRIVDRDGNHVFRLIGSKINPFVRNFEQISYNVSTFYLAICIS